MKRYPAAMVLLALTVCFAQGCFRAMPVPKAAPAAAPLPDTKPFQLAEEPADARGVLAVRKEAKGNDDVIIVGRIGGSRKPFTGRASFTIVDPSLKPCNEREDDACATPWDYCCDAPEDLKRATVLVKFVDDKGQTLPADAKAWLGIKELQTVLIRGKAKRDDDGNLCIVASGIFARR
jgi:hypothetical protein